MQTFDWCSKCVIALSLSNVSTVYTFFNWNITLNKYDTMLHSLVYV